MSWCMIVGNDVIPTWLAKDRSPIEYFHSEGLVVFV